MPRNNLRGLYFGNFSFPSALLRQISLPLTSNFSVRFVFQFNSQAHLKEVDSHVHQVRGRNSKVMKWNIFGSEARKCESKGCANVSASFHLSEGFLLAELPWVALDIRRCHDTAVLDFVVCISNIKPSRMECACWRSRNFMTSFLNEMALMLRGKVFNKNF